jgi:hypothetical protein
VTDTVTAIDVDHLAMDVDLATMALAPVVANRAIERKGKAHVPNKEMTMAVQTKIRVDRRAVVWAREA